MIDPVQQWHLADKDDVHKGVFAFVRQTESEQGDIYDRLALLESLYDQYSPTGDDTSSSTAKLLNVTDNVVASNVDTTYASVATAEVRSRFLTDDAEWSEQRRAKKLEYYVEGLGKQLRRHKKCRLAFKEESKKGVGLVKVYADRWRQPQIDQIRIEDVIVPDGDSAPGAPPLQMHHVMRTYDRERLKAEYPDAVDEIDSLYGTRSASGSGASPSTNPLLTRNKLTVIESWRLPIGRRPAPAPKRKKGQPAPRKDPKAAVYVPGRHTITIENKTLLDEPYHKPYHPVAVATWSDRQGSFYGISGAERIAGHQNALNKANWHMERILDQNALLTTYVRPADFNVATKATKVGMFVPIKGEYPQTPTPPLVHPEMYKRHDQLKASAFEEFGQNQAASHGTVPAGLETGAAVREVRQSQTQRFSPQEADFEQLCLDVDFLLVDVCKDLGEDAPTVIEYRWRKPIKWSEVDMGQVKIQISAASTLPRSAAGREQTVLEWAQAGIISKDSATRLIEHPDLESEISLYTAALETIDDQVEIILDGGIATPEPYDNLKMIEWRVTGRYHNTRRAGAPENILEALRDYISQAAYMADQMAQNDNAAQGSAPGAPGPQPGPPGQGAIGAPPDAGQPAAALSPQAMQLLAS